MDRVLWDVPGTWFGSQVVVLGDLNSDGVEDFGVADGPSGDSVTLFSGADRSELMRVPGSGHFGVGRLGDVNGDGVPDFLTGAFNEVVVRSGVDGSEIYRVTESSTTSGFGFSMDGIGDLNQDGIPDFAVGNPSFAASGILGSGAITWHSGIDGARLLEVHGNYAWQGLGKNVIGVGDVNADGYPDVLHGSSSSWQLYSGADGSIPASGGYFHSGAAAGDVNQDGYPDFVVAVNQPGTQNERQVEVRSGIQPTQVLFLWLEPRVSYSFGRDIASGGDVNGDGWNDVLVGANLETYSGKNAGSVYAYSGKSGELLSRWDADRQLDFFGTCVEMIADTDGDGRAEALIGAPQAHSGGLDLGAVYLYSDVSTQPILRVLQARAGYTMTVQAENCTPHGRVALLWSFAGNGPIQTQLGPAEISVPFDVADVRADADGEFSRSVQLPISMAGTPIWFHGADLDSGLMLNAVARWISL